MYELISGYRPYREYRTAAEMKKSVSRGTRPSLLKDGIYPCLPEMEDLMEVIRRDDPSDRHYVSFYRKRSTFPNV